jgi:hypothetical protein
MGRPLETQSCGRETRPDFLAEGESREQLAGSLDPLIRALHLAVERSAETRQDNAGTARQREQTR